MPNDFPAGDEPYDEYKELWQRNLSLMLRNLQTVGQNNLAEYLGVSNAKISDWKTKELPQLAKAMAFCMIQARSTSDRCFTEKQIQKYDMLVEFGREAVASYPRMGDIR